jgi:peptidoglycan hydrolase CwlO-like protein
MPTEKGAADPTGEEYRRGLRELLRSQPGMLMNILETVAASEEREPLRCVVEAALFVFSGEEDTLPGGRDFWDRMRSNIPLPAERPGPAAAREAGWAAVARFRREMESYAAGRPDLRRALQELDRRGVPPSPPQARAPGGEPPAPPGAGQAAVPRAPPQPPAVDGGAPAAPPFAQVIMPRPAAPAGDGEASGYKARAERAESELARKELFVKEVDAELRLLREKLRTRDEGAGSRALEERLAVHEEEARLARADLAKLEKKYRENLELLKEEARDRGSLQKHLDSSQAEVQRAQEKLREEQEKLADARRRLEKRERELETLEERLHSMEMELVRKEEEISMAMQHLRDEVSE